MGPNDEAVEEPESVSAGPVGSPPTSDSHGVACRRGRACGFFSSGVSALGYPSGRAGPPDSSAYGGSYLSTSLATGIAEARGVYAI